MTCLRNLVEVECCTTLYTLVFENGLVNGQGAFTQIEHLYFAWNNFYDNGGKGHRDKGQWKQENNKKQRYKGVKNEQDHSILNQLNGGI